jgi:hypothetical protein
MAGKLPAEVSQNSGANSRAPWTSVAIVISLLSFGLTGYQAYLAREENRLSVRPRVEADFRRASSGTAGVYVENRGIGPAEFRRVSVTFDGKAQNSWRQVLTAAGIAPLNDLTFAILRTGTMLSSRGVTDAG